MATSGNPLIDALNTRKGAPKKASGNPLIDALASGSTASAKKQGDTPAAKSPPMTAAEIRARYRAERAARPLPDQGPDISFGPQSGQSQIGASPQRPSALMEAARQDIIQGSTTTPIGKAYRAIGGQGLAEGSQGQAVPLVAGIATGPMRAATGMTKLAEVLPLPVKDRDTRPVARRVAEGVSDVLGGGFEAAQVPLLLAQSGFLAAMPAFMAAEKATEELLNASESIPTEMLPSHVRPVAEAFKAVASVPEYRELAQTLIPLVAVGAATRGMHGEAARAPVETPRYGVAPRLIGQSDAPAARVRAANAASVNQAATQGLGIMDARVAASSPPPLPLMLPQRASPSNTPAGFSSPRSPSIPPTRAIQLPEIMPPQVRPEQISPVSQRPVPERIETLEAQVQALGQGTNPVVFFPKGTRSLPEPPANARVTVVGEGQGAGTYYHTKFSQAQIRQAAKEGRHGELLGMRQPKVRVAEGQPAAVVARTQEGVEAKAAAVDALRPQDVAAQAETLRRQFPESDVGLEPLGQVVRERVAPEERPARTEPPIAAERGPESSLAEGAPPSAKQRAVEQSNREFDERFAREQAEAKPKDYILREEPEPLSPSGRKFMIYEAEGGKAVRPLYQMGETPQLAEQALRNYGRKVGKVTVQRMGEESTSSAKFERPVAAQERIVGEAVSGAEGRETQLKTPSGDLKAKYRVVESDSLVTSHDPQTFAVNQRYPSGVQERAYHSSKEAQSRVIEQTQKYDPSFTVNTNPDAVNGPPIVTRDGVVLGGNSRTMSTVRLYREGRGDVYRQRLTSEAEQYGLDPKSIEGMKNPVLVRELGQPVANIEQARRIGSDLNRSFTGALGTAERAVSAGKSVTQATLETLNSSMEAIGEGATIRDVLRENPKALLDRFVEDGIITARERPQFVDQATGGLSEAGKNFVESSLLGSVLDNVRLLDSAPKSVLAKVESSLGELARLKSRQDQWDITPLVRKAVEEHTAIRSRGMSVEDYLGQTSMFGGERVPAVDAVVRLLDQKSRDVKKAIREFGEDARVDVQGQGTLSFTRVPEAWDSFNRATGSNLTRQQFESGLETVLRQEVDALRSGKADTATPRGTESPRPTEPTAEVRPSENRLFTEADYLRAKENLNKNSGRLSSGVDPLLYADLIRMGGYHFERGLRTFAEWAARMVRDIPRIADMGDRGAFLLRTAWEEVTHPRPAMLFEAPKEQFTLQQQAASRPPTRLREAEAPKSGSLFPEQAVTKAPAKAEAKRPVAQQSETATKSMFSEKEFPYRLTNEQIYTRVGKEAMRKGLQGEERTAYIAKRYKEEVARAETPRKSAPQQAMPTTTATTPAQAVAGLDVGSTARYRGKKVVIEASRPSEKYGTVYDVRLPNQGRATVKSEDLTPIRRSKEAGFLTVPGRESLKAAGEKVKEGAKTAETQLLDRFAPIKDLTKASKLSAEADPYIGARLYAGHFGKVQNRLDQMSAILTPVRKLLPQLKEYAKMERFEELHGRGIEKLEGGMTIEQAKARKATIEKQLGPQKMAQVNQSVASLRKYTNRLLTEARDGGIISDAAYKAIIAKNEKYVPLQRIAYLAEKLDSVPKGANSFSVAKQDLVKSIKGSEKEVADPLESIVRNTYKTVSLVERNKVARQMADLSTRPEFKDVIFQSKGEVPQGFDKFSLLRKGVKEEWIAPQGVVEAMKGLNQSNIDIITRAAAKSSAALRAGATTFNVAFIGSNIVRDFQTATVVSKVGFTPLDWAYGLTHAIRRGDLYREYLESGASFSGFFEQNRSLAKTVKQITRTPQEKVLRTVLNPFELVRLGGEISELSPRIGVYRRAKGKAVSAEGSAFASREATVDFAKSGTAMRVMNLWVPFLNARTQGTLNVLKSIRNRPVASLLKMSAIIGAPLLATYAWNTRVFPKVWDDIPAYEKDNNFVFIYGDEQDEDGRYTQAIKIPKGDVGRLYGNHLENWLTWVDTEKSHKPLDEISLETLSDISPVSFVKEGKLSPSAFFSGILPPTVKAGVEVATNKNLYTERDIVPFSMQRASPELQYKKTTSPIAKKIGKTFGVSPLKVENFAGTQFGGLGRQLINPKQAPSIIGKRFAGVRGGGLDQKEVAVLEDLLRGQQDQRITTRREAEELHAKLKTLSPEKANEQAEEIRKSNPSVFKQLVDIVQDERLGLTYKDRLVKQLGVENGERAEYIFGLLDELDTVEEKNAMVEELRRKKLISQRVMEQLVEMKKSRSPLIPPPALFMPPPLNLPAPF